MSEEMDEAEFAALERNASLAADGLVTDILMVLQERDTETLRAIADYREAITLGDWTTRMIREYLSVWR